MTKILFVNQFKLLKTLLKISEGRLHGSVGGWAWDVSWLPVFRLLLDSARSVSLSFIYFLHLLHLYLFVFAAAGGTAPHFARQEFLLQNKMRDTVGRWGNRGQQSCFREVCIRAQPIYLLADIIGQYCPISQIHCIGIDVYVLQYALIFKTVFLTRKNAWTSDLKLCSSVVCPAEGSLLFNN